MWSLKWRHALAIGRALPVETTCLHARRIVGVEWNVEPRRQRWRHALAIGRAQPVETTCLHARRIVGVEWNVEPRRQPPRKSLTIGRVLVVTRRSLEAKMSVDRRPSTSTAVETSPSTNARGESLVLGTGGVPAVATPSLHPKTHADVDRLNAAHSRINSKEFISRTEGRLFLTHAEKGNEHEDGKDGLGENV